MKIDLFCELQRAQPYRREDERQLIDETLEQARVADEVGYGCWWSVEHHGTPGFSHSSTPELFNLLVATNTSRIRIGHSGVLAPFNINHPIRVAERAAFLDIISDGRLELGLARSSVPEWDAFGVDGGSSRDQMMELFDMLPQMWESEAFSWDTDLLRIPERNVVPKPLQTFPPLWQTCTSEEAFRLAGEAGVGALGTTLLSPIDSLRQLREAYKGGIAAAAPRGRTVNDQFAVFTFVHCAESRDEAIVSRAGEAVLWYINSGPKVFQAPRKMWMDNIRGNLLSGKDPAAMRASQPSESIEVDPDDPVPVIRLLNRQLLGEELDPEEVYDVLDEIESVIIGDPDTCLAKMKRYADVGVDRLMCFQQFGSLDNDRAVDSIRRVGDTLIPTLSA